MWCWSVVITDHQNMGKQLKISWLERFLTPAPSFCCFGFARPASYFLIREAHFVIRLFVAACLNYTCRLKQKEMVRFEMRNSNLKCLHSSYVRSWISSEQPSAASCGRNFSVCWTRPTLLKSDRTTSRQDLKFTFRLYLVHHSTGKTRRAFEISGKYCGTQGALVDFRGDPEQRAGLPKVSWAHILKKMLSSRMTTINDL